MAAATTGILKEVKGLPAMIEDSGRRPASVTIAQRTHTGNNPRIFKE